MKVVYLDAHTLNPNDLSWERAEKLGNFTAYPRTTPQEVIVRSLEADCVLTNKVVFSKEIIAQLPRLKYIGVTATGFNVVDIEAAKQQGIIVTNIPEYGTKAVAQHTFALILALSNQIVTHHQSVLRGDWSNSIDWTYTLKPLQELEGKILGIAGMGQIGQATAKIGQAFGMQIVFFNRTPKNIADAEQVSKEELFRRSDVLSLHLPLNAETQAFINADSLAMMKKNALIINTSRGGLVQEDALAEALNQGKIAGAGVDVLSQEPAHLDNPLLKAQNILITPHNAWIAQETRQRLLTIALDNLASFLEGNPKNVVNF